MWNDMDNMEENREEIGKIQKIIVKRYGKYGRKVSWIVKWYGKIRKKSRLNSEIIWEKQGRKAIRIVIRYGQYGRKASLIVKWYGKIWKKSKLKCEIIWKIRKKDKSNSDKIWTI